MSRTRQKRLARASRLKLSTHWSVWLELGLFLLIGISASVALFWYVAQG
ncbi:MAG: hypothetical protein ACFB0E_08485 [Leptolyngbyaceae cyanobacterium]